MHDIGSPHTSNVGTGVRYVCALAVQVHVLCFVVLIVVARAGGGGVIHAPRTVRGQHTAPGARVLSLCVSETVPGSMPGQWTPVFFEYEASCA